MRRHMTLPIKKIAIQPPQRSQQTPPTRRMENMHLRQTSLYAEHYLPSHVLGLDLLSRGSKSRYDVREELFRLNADGEVVEGVD